MHGASAVQQYSSRGVPRPHKPLDVSQVDSSRLASNQSRSGVFGGLKPVSPCTALHEAGVHALQVKAFTSVAALLSTLAVAAHYFFAVATFEAQERLTPITSNSSTAVVPIVSRIYQDDGAGVLVEPAILAYLLWQGLGTSAVGMVLALFVWWDATGGVVLRAWHVVLPIVVTVVLNLSWMSLWLVLHAQGLVSRSHGFLASWFTLQVGVLTIVPFLWRRLLATISRRPIRFTLIFCLLALINAYLLTEVLVGVYNRSMDGVRILIRLLVVPCMVEALSAALRFAARLLMRGDVPGATRGFVQLPVVLSNALIGRFFSTGLNSAALSYVLSFAVAALEVTMRYTAPLRDKYFARCARLFRKRVCVSCCDAQPRRASTAPGLGGEGGVDWDDLSPATQHARTTRAHYAFITLDTVSEDIGMLTLIPVAIFFRLPTRIGGQPLPLGDVLLRVGFQWLLELWTDVGPFVTYAACRAWLVWRGDVLYSGLTQDVMLAARSLRHKHSERTQGHASVEKAVSHNTQAEDVQSAPVISIDDAVEPGMPQQSATETKSPVPLLPLSRPDSDEMLALSASASQGQGQSEASARDSNAGDTLLLACRAALPCTLQRHLPTAMQQVRDSRAPLLADDADVLWQRLPWTAVRAAMAPGAGAGEWSWLHWFTYQNELLAARMSASWRRRQHGWSVWVLVVSFLLVGFIIRTNVGTQQMCPFLDSQGSWYWDACSDSPQE